MKDEQNKPNLRIDPVANGWIVRVFTNTDPGFLPSKEMVATSIPQLQALIQGVYAEFNYVGPEWSFDPDPDDGAPEAIASASVAQARPEDLRASYIIDTFGI